MNCRERKNERRKNPTRPGLNKMLTLNARLAHDPTRTTDIRASYTKDVEIRLRKILALVRSVIIGKEAIQFDPTLLANIDAPSRIGSAGMTPEELADAFIAWLTKIEDEILLEVTRDGNGNVSSRDPWQDQHVQATYLRAVTQAELRMQAQGLAIATREVRQLLNDPFHSDALHSLFNTNFEAFQTVVDFGNGEIAEKMRQEIILGYAETTPRVAASGRRYLSGPTRRELSKRIFAAFEDRFEKIIRTRSEMIVRTEIIRAHAEASLNSFAERNIAKTAALVEFATANDARVCILCKNLEGDKFTIENARGVIPVHPRCRCVWIPVVDEVIANRMIRNWYQMVGRAA